MNILGFEIRKFEKNPTTIQIIETWCVRWSSLHRNFIDSADQKINVLGFPSKDGADKYAKELTDARKLLGDTGFPPEVYVQRVPTNA